METNRILWGFFLAFAAVALGQAVRAAAATGISLPLASLFLGSLCLIYAAAHGFRDPKAFAAVDERTPAVYAILFGMFLTAAGAAFAF
ncbi:hypothetical protein ACNS7O_13110 [Haloferacaceae archaeon DSL9]